MAHYLRCSEVPLALPHGVEQYGSGSDVPSPLLLGKTPAPEDRKMTDAPRKLLVAACIALSSFAIAAVPGSDIAISGWVIDSACAYTKGLDKPISPACAKTCAKNGS